MNNVHNLVLNQSPPFGFFLFLGLNSCDNSIQNKSLSAADVVNDEGLFQGLGIFVRCSSRLES